MVYVCMYALFMYVCTYYVLFMYVCIYVSMYVYSTLVTLHISIFLEQFSFYKNSFQKCVTA